MSGKNKQFPHHKNKKYFGSRRVNSILTAEKMKKKNRNEGDFLSKQVEPLLELTQNARVRVLTFDFERANICIPQYINPSFIST